MRLGLQRAEFCGCGVSVWVGVWKCVKKEEKKKITDRKWTACPPGSGTEMVNYHVSSLQEVAHCDARA